MKKITILFLFIFSSVITYSQDFEFDFLPSGLNEEILENENYIKPHFLGSAVANKVKLLELAYKWVDPPTATRLNSMIRIEKQPIYFAMSKIIATKYYRKKINENTLTKEEAIEQISEILDIAIMIRYQDTKEFENYIRSLNGDRIVEVFTKNVKLSYF
ncbi:uncharacterized protein METZ01_LOCUS44462 [marine metagenome]|uniref:Uncharacterized protein n=1 Tax=marine metagenome TaxID=408172 RepID=A0A381RKY6_9ZZZZ